MAIPDSPISKAIARPGDAATYLWNNTVGSAWTFPRRAMDKHIYTPWKGRYLFDYDWELAIILDACRYDLAVDRGQKHSIGLPAPEKVYSVASTSNQWIRRTFTDMSAATLSETAYISANLFTNEVPNEISVLDKVFEYAWDSDLGTVPPRPLTDRTIRLMRDGVAERYVVHYIQPHLPPVEQPEEGYGREQPPEGLEGEFSGSGYGWESARSGNDPERVVRDYQRNLYPVLDEVQLLLENVSTSKVVITADHGNYLGEKGRWGHPRSHIHPAVRAVPWWETTATDEQTHLPDTYERNATPHLKEQLKHLGYR